MAKRTKTRLPLLTHLCNVALENYNNHREATHPVIEQVEDKINRLAHDVQNVRLVNTLIANRRLTRTPSGHLFIRLDT